jgi:hypothetical protein
MSTTPTQRSYDSVAQIRRLLEEQADWNDIRKRRDENMTLAEELTGDITELAAEMTEEKDEEKYHKLSQKLLELRSDLSQVLTVVHDADAALEERDETPSRQVSYDIECLFLRDTTS